MQDFLVSTVVEPRRLMLISLERIRLTKTSFAILVHGREGRGGGRNHEATGVGGQEQVVHVMENIFFEIVVFVLATTNHCCGWSFFIDFGPPIFRFLDTGGACLLPPLSL